MSLDIHAREESDAIRETLDLLRNATEIQDFGTFCAEVRAREAIKSTASPAGVAFPHARSDSVEQLVFAIGRSRKGVAFGESRTTVHFIVVIGSPKEQAREYLMLVGELARIFRNPIARDKLMQAAAPEEFAAILKSVEP